MEKKSFMKKLTGSTACSDPGSAFRSNYNHQPVIPYI